jgi:regulator of protease activity HflC (stomatin/prohibitin superfamily)
MRFGFGFGLALVLGVMLLLVGALWAWPSYNVYRAEMRGRAELARAQQNRKIRVYEAQARMDSARLNAQAEVAAAQGVAQANKIIADSLGGPEGYLRWRYIEMLNETGKDGPGRDVIYVPTEAGLPILEAGKRPTGAQ